MPTIPKAKILLVEDNPQTAQFYQEFLSTKYDVDLSPDGQIGLETLRQNPLKYSLILLDIMLPKVDGVALLEIKQKDPKIAAIPLVLLTNFDDKATIHHCLEIGAKSCLMKSNITPDKILNVVDNLIG
ncbi:MAG: response regulator [Candidatus Shapirobacteria bacterium]|jgi:DNA-binding response OmpR family regulator